VSEKLNPWLLRQSGRQRRLRLYCFSCAGGNAAHYLHWQAALDPMIEVCAVQLPGRGARMEEPPLRSFSLLVETLADIVGDNGDMPFAFFGHSLGGTMAFELARECRRRHLPMPEHLFVSACNAPQMRSRLRRLHELDDPTLIAALKNYNGTPPAALEHEELMQLLLPVIRADFEVASQYQYRPDTPLDIPITVLAGKSDHHVMSKKLNRWQEETTEECDWHWFDGDHFFVHSQQKAVLGCLQAKLLDHSRSYY
jgi:surfactin synthase thioesterase subunit